ncbi:MAG: hypothetical protein ACT6FG_00405 [Methanosarcinaceae archaeon]
MKLIGMSKVAIQKKITIIEEVATDLDLVVGDHVAFLKSDSGYIIIQKLSDVEVNNLEEK